MIFGHQPVLDTPVKNTFVYCLFFNISYIPWEASEKQEKLHTHLHISMLPAERTPEAGVKAVCIPLASQLADFHKTPSQNYAISLMRLQ